MANLTTAVKNRKAIADIKRRYDKGQISREQAKTLAQPVIDKINARNEEIARKYGKKYYPKLDFINAMRNSY
jgi:polyhydroxyalkanoate synthesis regulator phasin